MKIKYLLVGLFIILTTKGYSQFDNYIEGYIVKESRDTIIGKLKNMSAEKSCFKIKFIDSNGNKVKFKDKDVYAYKRGTEVYFKKSYERPISINNMQGYMKLIDDGVIKLYKFNYVVRNAGTMNANGVMTGGESSYQQDYYIEKNNNFLLVRKMGFKRTMAEYFSDNKELADKISSKALRYKDLKEIIRAYNKRQE
ncbi:hypothetical protein EO244_16560 [Ancylomarina salipaludis]|uniref:Uncharacterized protein n=1 Tax=Ancylomarina salipaludis TaxID=2501299 RepID=A0A4Q1JHL0_9BACT|nr:hypothetical protein [Ancylomarina salipaludis]RXQ87290.1 hypothetical protein EO244_16560 [Ancylomarina salipaludis]